MEVDWQMSDYFMVAFLIFDNNFFQIVMDDHQRSDGIPVTRFTLQSIYAQSDDEKLQFEYESGNTNILVRILQVNILNVLNNMT